MRLLKHLLKLRPADPTAHAMLAVLQFREGNCAAAPDSDSDGWNDEQDAAPYDNQNH